VKHFPRLLEEEIKTAENYDTHKKPPLEEIIFLSIDKLVRKLKSTDIDMNFSGTTCNMCLIKNELLYVTNIGDSRSIIGYREDSKKLKI
jgi:serine/threonine protein phosphatase PrpC